MSSADRNDSYSSLASVARREPCESSVSWCSYKKELLKSVGDASARCAGFLTYEFLFRDPEDGKWSVFSPLDIL